MRPYNGLLLCALTPGLIFWRGLGAALHGSGLGIICFIVLRRTCITCAPWRCHYMWRRPVQRWFVGLRRSCVARLLRRCLYLTAAPLCNDWFVGLRRLCINMTAAVLSLYVAACLGNDGSLSCGGRALRGCRGAALFWRRPLLRLFRCLAALVH